MKLLLLLLLTFAGTIWARCSHSDLHDCSIARTKEGHSGPLKTKDISALTTISFDDAGVGDEQTVPYGYNSMVWNNAYILDGVTYGNNPSGYGYGIVSGSDVMYNGYGDDLSFSQTSMDPFTLVSVYATAAWNDQLIVEFTGYLANTSVLDVSFTLSAYYPSQLLFSSVVVDIVIVHAYGGTPVFSGGGTHVAFDNLVVAPAQGGCPAGQALKGTHCVNCPAGTAGSGWGPCQVCMPGTSATVAGSSACTVCGTGHYSSGGAAGCKECLVGYWSFGGGSYCSPCSAGYFAAATGATECSACPAGKYSCAGKSSCVSCPAGKYSGGAAAACDYCPPGTFSATTGSSTCSLCPAGTWAGTGKSSCTPCVAPKTSPAGSFAAAQCV